MEIKRFEHSREWHEARELTNKITVVLMNGNTAAQQHGSTAGHFSSMNPTNSSNSRTLEPFVFEAEE